MACELSNTCDKDLNVKPFMSSLAERSAFSFMLARINRIRRTDGVPKDGIVRTVGAKAV